nr:uncharacterized protein CTRU02_04648 [Colletotrichum truncatum]KAF6795085.1 hypothetical protein CTRU02_04648 [Colletotrichum truncatum]
MKTTSILAMAFTTAAVNAGANPPAPLIESGPVGDQKACPRNWAVYGICNGKSCMWNNGINYACDKGKCTGKGGGDGSCCGWKTQNWFSMATCPNGGW